MRRTGFLSLLFLAACAETPFIPVSDLPEVRPVAETEAVETAGDAADDPAIWVDIRRPSASLIVGTNKDRGLDVYGLDGGLLYRNTDGRMNNVDLRGGFPLGGRDIVLVAASNRSNDSLSLYELQPDGPGLRHLADIATGFAEPYGLCLYHSAATGNHYAFVNDKSGLMRQWQLTDNGRGGIAAEAVREFDVGSQPEGCVADDELGHLYVGEEATGIWKYGAEPTAGSARRAVDTTAGPHLTADVEGMGLYHGENGKGYLVVSSQGDYSYAVYAREGNNVYLGSFRVADAAAIDGVQETDGLDVVRADLGPGYPRGLLVVQDGFNMPSGDNQNFKYVSFAQVLEILSRP